MFSREKKTQVKHGRCFKGVQDELELLYKTSKQIRIKYVKISLDLT